MPNERYILQKLEELERQIRPAPQMDNRTIIKADNGEFMDLYSPTNLENMAKARATWAVPEMSMESLRAKHDPTPPAGPILPAPPPPPPVEPVIIPIET